MDLGDVQRVPVLTCWVREQYVWAGDSFGGREGPDNTDPATNLENEDWIPEEFRASGSSPEYTESLQLAVEFYHRNDEYTHRVWVETRIRME